MPATTSRLRSPASRAVEWPTGAAASAFFSPASRPSSWPTSAWPSRVRPLSRWLCSLLRPASASGSRRRRSMRRSPRLRRRTCGARPSVPLPPSRASATSPRQRRPVSSGRSCLRAWPSSTSLRGCSSASLPSSPPASGRTLRANDAADVREVLAVRRDPGAELAARLRGLPDEPEDRLSRRPHLGECDPARALAALNDDDTARVARSDLAAQVHLAALPEAGEGDQVLDRHGYPRLGREAGDTRLVGGLLGRPDEGAVPAGGVGRGRREGGE